MPREEIAKKTVLNCAKADTSKNYSNSLPGDILSDLQQAFSFYDKEETGHIQIQHFRNILHNFGFHKLGKREIDADLNKCDQDFTKRNCVDFAFCKHAVGYRWVAKGGRDDEAKECFRVFDKKERGVVSLVELRTVLNEYISTSLNDDDVREFMKEVDPNNNGNIAAKDFIKLYLS